MEPAVGAEEAGDWLQRLTVASPVFTIASMDRDETLDHLTTALLALSEAQRRAWLVLDTVSPAVLDQLWGRDSWQAFADEARSARDHVAEVMDAIQHQSS